MSVWVFLLSMLSCGEAVAQQGVPGVSSGIDSLVLYDADHRPVQRLTMMPALNICASLDGKSFVINSPGTDLAQLHNGDGTNVYNFYLGAPARRIAASHGAYVITLGSGQVLELNATGTITNQSQVRDVVWAEKHPQQGMVIANQSGELQRIDWNSDKPFATFGSTAAGRPVRFEALSVLPSGQVLAFDSVSKELVTLDSNLGELERHPIQLEAPVLFQTFGAAPSVLIKGASENGIRIVNGDRSVSSFLMPLDVACGGALPAGGFMLGFKGRGVSEPQKATFKNLDTKIPSFTYDCLAAIVIYAVLGAWLFARGWIAIVNRFFPRNGSAIAPDNVAGDSTVSSRSVSRRSWLASIVTVLAWCLAVAAIAAGWWVYPELAYPDAYRPWMIYLACAVMGGLSLLYLGARFGLASRLRAAIFVASERKGRNRVYWTLLLVAILLGVFAIHLSIEKTEPKVMVAAWLSAQVLLVMAFGRIGATKSGCTRPQLWAVLALCAGTLATRLLWIGEYPHDIHHDFGVAGQDVFLYLIESWVPFFTLDAGQTLGRPWFMQMAAIFWLFGFDDATMRLSSAVWAVGFVLAAYLIGRETISHRFGLIFGALVGAQHNLLGYSRSPYVTESTAPFLFCLYYVCRGFRTHHARDFAIAGLWAAWSMMSVRNFTPFPFIGLSLIAFFVLAYPRIMWALRWHVLVMTLAAALCFGPILYFFLYEQHISGRLSDVSPLFKNFELSRDLSVWTYQFGRSFGGILVYPDRVSWPAEASAPICLALTGALFGVGLVTALGRFRSVGASMAFITVFVDTALGSAFLDGPPSYYHQFVAIALVMYFVAIPLEFLWELATRAKSRLLGGGMVAGLTVVAIVAVIEQAWPFIEFSMPKKWVNGEPQPRYDVQSFLARYVLHHSHRRFIGIASETDHFQFNHARVSLGYGIFSDRYETYTDISHYLPVRPDPERKDVTFLLKNDEALARIRTVYPTGEVERHSVYEGEIVLITYTVTGGEIERVWRSEVTRRDSPFRDAFALKASS